ncbi:gelsolin, cytoplasmic [Agrilus planipennis]|uniref:Gelsolin, cytoplasmic n=1 Tax=Agrilus planipennis TaxID=224129 RepID=A0A7F5QXL2_AGRPL|nr:gelsolin, cytoplasmic [Agrilus planipennis]
MEPKSTSVTASTRLRSRPQFLLALLLSLCFSCCLITSCNALTTFGRQSGRPSSPSIINGNNNGKFNAKRPRVMAEAFANAGQRAGLEIWRIENFEPKAYPAKDYGKFYTGDSYIVLSTKEKKGVLSWDIHFWLGKETTQDESGAAAIYTVQLDEQLGGAPVQHREVQDHESQLFLSYFKNGVRYLAGGVNSGFTHVDPNAFEKRLFHVKGKRNIKVRQVDATIASMNTGDCYILDVGRDVYVYTGKDSKRVERLKAISAANQIRDQDHSGRARVHIIDDASDEAEVQSFFDALGGGSLSEIPDESAGESDAESDIEEEPATLYKVSDSNGPIKITPVAQKPLRQNMLDSNDCFILDTGDANIFVWTGRNCKKSERDQAMSKAQEYLRSKGRPGWTRVQRVVEGTEPTIFRQYFATWQGHGELHPRLLRSVVDEPASKLEDKSGGEAPGFMPDDGTGEVEVLRVTDSEVSPVPPESEGKLFGDDCYLIKYKTVEGSWVVYIWEGKRCSDGDKFTAFLKAIEFSKENGETLPIVRVVQNYEPKHLLHIFKGKLVTFLSGNAASFKSITDYDGYVEGETRLYKIRGTNAQNSRAIQVEPKASSLESDDVFVAENDNTAWIWFGKNADEAEKELGHEFVKILAPGWTPVEVDEDVESDEFWDALGGEGAHAASYEEDLNVPEEARLFHVHVKKARAKIEEIHDFTQEDLDDDDVMILESPSEVFIWIGNNSTEEERRVMGKKLKPLQRHNRHNSVLFFIKQGHEPSNFISNFPSWDPELWETSASKYVDVKARIQELNAAIVDEED